jgi:Ala-tRNA(Pro) deacylase
MPNPEAFLKSKNIKYILHEHPPVYTCEEADKHCGHIPGLACKNLLLKGKKSGRYFLVVLPAEKKADLKKIGEIVDDKKISLAKPVELLEKLGLEPGAVSPFGLINDTNHEVEVFIDQKVYNAKIVNFHPNRNTASLELSGDMFQKFLKEVENEVRVIEL